MRLAPSPRQAAAPSALATAWPIALVAAALTLLVLNDQVLKPFGGFWVGKLSDVTGLLLVPVPLTGLWLAVCRWHGVDRPLPRGWLCLHPVTLSAVVCAVFIAAKLDSTAAAWTGALWPWPAAWGPTQVLADPTDLWTLPFLPLGLWVARRFWQVQGLPGTQGTDARQRG